MSSILQELEQQIAGITSSVEKSNVGTVRQVGDGVAKVEGLSDVMLNEMIDFGGGVTGTSGSRLKAKPVAASTSAALAPPWVLTKRKPSSPNANSARPVTR